MAEKFSVVNVRMTECVTLENANDFNIDFEAIDAIWDEDVKRAEQALGQERDGENDLLMQEYNKLVKERDERINVLRKKIEKLEDELKHTEFEGKEGAKQKIAKIETKEKIEQKLAKELKNDIKKPKSVVNKKPLMQKAIEEYAAENGQLVGFIKDRMFVTTTDGYYFFEDGKIEYKNEKQIQKLRRKLDAKSKIIAKKALDDVGRMFVCKVSDGEELVNMKTKVINLARKFNFNNGACNATKDDIDKANQILNFILEVICGGNEDQYNCMLNVITCMAKRKQSQIIVYLCALGGVGKSFFAEVLQSIFGDAYVNCNEQVISGETEFNDVLRGSVIAVLSETSGKGTEAHMKIEKGLKRFSTDATLRIRKLFSEGTEVINLINFFVLSNYIDMDIGDRRMFTPDISNKYQGDSKYFGNLHECKTQGALQYLYNFFFNRETPAFISIPTTTSKEEHREATMPSVVKYVIDTYMVRNQYEEHYVKTNDFFSMYQQWAKGQKIIAFRASNKFHHFCRQCFLERATNKDGSKRISNGSEKYDLSYNNIYQNIVERSKWITPQRLAEMVSDFKKELESIGEQNDSETPFFSRDELEYQIKDLRKTISKRDEEIALLKEALAEKEKTHKPIAEEAKIHKINGEMLSVLSNRHQKQICKELSKLI